MQSEFDEAKEQLDKAIALDGRNGRAYFELGLLLQRAEEASRGRASRCRKAVQLVAERIAVLVRLRRDLSALGSRRRSDQRVQEGGRSRSAVSEGADQARPPARGAQAVRRGRDRADASGPPRRARSAQNYMLLGVVYAAKRKPKQAIENYELFLKYAPKNDPDRPRVHQCYQRVEALDPLSLTEHPLRV